MSLMSNSGAPGYSSKTVKCNDRYTIKKYGEMSTSTLLNKARELAQELDHHPSTLSDCLHASWYRFFPGFPLKHTSRVKGESTHSPH